MAVLYDPRPADTLVLPSHTIRRYGSQPLSILFLPPDRVARFISNSRVTCFLYSRFSSSTSWYFKSQWSRDSIPDCSARGPGIESRCGQLCLL